MSRGWEAGVLIDLDGCVAAGVLEDRDMTRGGEIMSIGLGISGTGAGLGMRQGKMKGVGEGDVDLEVGHGAVRRRHTPRPVAASIFEARQGRLDAPHAELALVRLPSANARDHRLERRPLTRSKALSGPCLRPKSSLAAAEPKATTHSLSPAAQTSTTTLPPTTTRHKTYTNTSQKTSRTETTGAWRWRRCGIAPSGEDKGRTGYGKRASVTLM